MNHKDGPAPRPVSRITCTVHRQLGRDAEACFQRLGTHTVLAESARCVRQQIRRAPLGLQHLNPQLHTAPMEIFRTTVDRTAAGLVLRELCSDLDLTTPGRGMVFAQDLIEISRITPPDLPPWGGTFSGLIEDLTLITGIFSRTGSGEAPARAALQLGAAVPVISSGTGTGIRDRIGLLRITIPPEKELVHLIVPSQDAQEVQRLLIESTHLGRPGGGFLYHAPIRAGVVDPLIRIGPQEHAASMEQLIAAVDDLKKSTAWRKRFAGIDPSAARRPASRPHREIVFVCAEGQSGRFVDAALRAGAGGATTTRVRCLSSANIEGGTAARERGILCVPAAQEGAVIDALTTVGASLTDPAPRLQLLDAPLVFSHQGNRP